MRKLWLCLFYALCVFTIVFSLFWMALPRLPLGRADSAEETPVPSLPSISVQAVPETGSTTYYLCDEGGRVVVWQCDADGTPVQRVLRTGIYVNLLPEGVDIEIDIALWGDLLCRHEFMRAQRRCVQAGKAGDFAIGGANIDNDSCAVIRHKPCSALFGKCHTVPGR